MKFLQGFVQKISSSQTNKLTNEHPDTMLISCFLASPDPKTCQSAKNRKSQICTITKVPHHTMYDGELKLLSPNVILTLYYKCFAVECMICFSTDYHFFTCILFESEKSQFQWFVSVCVLPVYRGSFSRKLGPKMDPSQKWMTLKRTLKLKIIM